MQKNSNLKGYKPPTEVFEIYLLQDKSVRNLYQNRLNWNPENRLKEDIDGEWEKIKECITCPATEAIGTVTVQVKPPREILKM